MTDLTWVNKWRQLSNTIRNEWELVQKFNKYADEQEKKFNERIKKSGGKKDVSEC